METGKRYEYILFKNQRSYNALSEAAIDFVFQDFKQGIGNTERERENRANIMQYGWLISDTEKGLAKQIPMMFRIARRFRLMKDLDEIWLLIRKTDAGTAATADFVAAEKLTCTGRIKSTRL